MKIPFIILTKERPVQFREMIESIERTTPPDAIQLIICDNGSEQPEMKDYLRSIESKYHVIYNGSNMLFHGANVGLRHIGDAKYFIFSDPDIALGLETPSNWVDLLTTFLDNTNFPKVGVALNTAKIPQGINGGQHIYNIENSYYNNPQSTHLFPDKYYICVTDTTLCMYRRDTYSYWNPAEIPQFRPIPNGSIPTTGVYHPKYHPIPVRIGGRFIADHLGWEMPTKYQSDLQFYKKSIEEGRSSRLVASTLRTYKIT